MKRKLVPRFDNLCYCMPRVMRNSLWSLSLYGSEFCCSYTGQSRTDPLSRHEVKNRVNWTQGFDEADGDQQTNLNLARARGTQWQTIILLTAAKHVPFLQPGSPCSQPIFEHHFSFRLRHALTFAAAIMMGVWGKAAS